MLHDLFRVVSFSPLHFMLNRGKSIIFGTVNILQYIHTCTRYCHILSLSSYLEDRLRQNQFKILYILMKAESLIKSGNLLLWEKNLRTAQRDALSSCTRTITSRDDTFYTFKHLNIYIFASLLKFVLRI